MPTTIIKKWLLGTCAASVLLTGIPLSNAYAATDTPTEEKATPTSDKKESSKTLEQIEKEEKVAKKKAEKKAAKKAKEEADAVSNAAIEKKKAQIKKLDTTLRKSSKLYGDLQDSITEMEDEYEVITNRIALIDEQTSKKIELMGEKEKELAKLRNEIEKTDEKRAAREEDFKERASTIYTDRNGGEFSRIVDVVLNSDGFSSVINNLISYKKIVKMDNDVIEEYMDLVKQLETQTAQAEQMVLDIQETLKELAELKKENQQAADEKLALTQKLDKRRAALKEEIIHIKNSQSDAKGELNGLIEEEILSGLLANIEKSANKERKSAEKALEEATEQVATTMNTTVTEKELDMQAVATVKSTKQAIKSEDLNDYYHYINYYAKKYDIPSALVKAVIQTESGFRADATNVNTNGTVDRGLMQLNSNTAPGVARQLGWDYKVGIEFVPKKAIEMGSYYLSSIYSSDLHRMLSSYNRGTAGAKRYYAANGTYVTTYSAKVVSYLKIYVAEEQKTKNGYKTDKAAALLKIASTQSLPKVITLPKTSTPSTPAKTPTKTPAVEPPTTSNTDTPVVESTTTEQKLHKESATTSKKPTKPVAKPVTPKTESESKPKTETVEEPKVVEEHTTPTIEVTPAPTIVENTTDDVTEN